MIDFEEWGVCKNFDLLRILVSQNYLFLPNVITFCFHSSKKCILHEKAFYSLVDNDTCMSAHTL